MPSFRKLFGGGSRSREPSKTSNSDKEPDGNQEKHGLFVLYPQPDVVVDPEIDIIAIHGLNGDAARTWTDPTTGKLWLKDFLPNMCPRSRIMSFGYNSSVVLSNSTAGIEDYARDLLNRLNGIRQSETEQKRPIVFICHSLGGIVAKKAYA